MNFQSRTYAGIFWTVAVSSGILLRPAYLRSHFGIPHRLPKPLWHPASPAAVHPRMCAHSPSTRARCSPRTRTLHASARCCAHASRITPRVSLACLPHSLLRCAPAPALCCCWPSFCPAHWLLFLPHAAGWNGRAWLQCMGWLGWCMDCMFCLVFNPFSTFDQFSSN